MLAFSKKGKFMPEIQPSTAGLTIDAYNARQNLVTAADVNHNQIFDEGDIAVVQNGFGSYTSGQVLAYGHPITQALQVPFFLQAFDRDKVAETLGVTLVDEPKDTEHQHFHVLQGTTANGHQPYLGDIRAVNTYFDLSELVLVIANTLVGIPDSDITVTENAKQAIHHTPTDMKVVLDNNTLLYAPSFGENSGPVPLNGDDSAHQHINCAVTLDAKKPDSTKLDAAVYECNGALIQYQFDLTTGVIKQKD